MSETIPPTRAEFQELESEVNRLHAMLVALMAAWAEHAAAPGQDVEILLSKIERAAEKIREQQQRTRATKRELLAAARSLLRKAASEKPDA